MIDHTKKNNKMLIRPVWRTSRKMWRRKVKFQLIPSNTFPQGDFKRYARQFKSGELTQSAWQPASLSRAEDPYVYGLEEIGRRNQVRNRIKEKDMGDLIFQGVLPKNIWNSRINISKSIRTQKYDNAFKLKPNYNYYRESPKIISYKTQTFK